MSTSALWVDGGLEFTVGGKTVLVPTSSANELLERLKASGPAGLDLVSRLEEQRPSDQDAR